MSNTSALAKRVKAAIREYKAKQHVNNSPVPILFYDPDDKREATWINGPMPDDYHGTVIYLPYKDDEDNFRLV
jgi:hypothetical protein